MEIDERVGKLEDKVNKIEEKVNSAIPEIQAGIREIKIMLQEKPIQEDLKNSLIEKEIVALDNSYSQKNNNIENRLKKVEDNQSWLWKSVAGSIITIVISAIVAMIKIM